MSLVFSENSKNSQNHDIFLGAVMGRLNKPTTLFGSWLSDNLSQISNIQKLFVYHSYPVRNSSYSINNTEKNWLFHFGDPPSVPQILFSIDLFCVKRRQLSIYKNWPNPLAPNPHPGSVALGAGCFNAAILSSINWIRIVIVWWIIQNENCQLNDHEINSDELTDKRRVLNMSPRFELSGPASDVPLCHILNH